MFLSAKKYFLLNFDETSRHCETLFIGHIIVIIAKIIMRIIIIINIKLNGANNQNENQHLTRCLTNIFTLGNFQLVRVSVRGRKLALSIRNARKTIPQLRNKFSSRLHGHAKVCITVLGAACGREYHLSFDSHETAETAAKQRKQQRNTSQNLGMPRLTRHHH